MATRDSYSINAVIKKMVQETKKTFFMSSNFNFCKMNHFSRIPTSHKESIVLHYRVTRGPLDLAYVTNNDKYLPNQDHRSRFAR